MPYDAPGVYIQYKTDGPLVVRAASTSTAVFIGPTRVGTSVTAIAPSLQIAPKFVTSLGEYSEEFTTTGSRAGVVSMPTENNDFTDAMGHAVRGFFMNGGQRAYIVSTSTTTQAKATLNLKVTDSTGDKFYRVDAVSDGAWGNDVLVSVSQSGIGADYLDLRVALAMKGEGTDIITDSEQFLGQKGDALAAIKSAKVAITALPADPGGSTVEIDVSAGGGTEDSAKLTGGVDSGASAATDYGAIFGALKDIADISLIVLADKVWPAAQSDYSHAITHCQDMKDRMVLIQLDDLTTDFANITVPMDKYASVYYPSVKVSLPAGSGTRTATVNSVGHVAGVFARTDGDKGPWTAPAGMHANIAGITEFNKDISLPMQERMNPHNVNALRYIQGVPVVWGARTRDKGGIYEYIPVMRTAFLIADSLRDALNRVVFAKNTQVLWGNVKAGVNGFMDGLFSQGAFQGATPSQAFRVAVGLGETMTQDDIRKGLLKLNVAFAPAFPAEVIEITIEQIFESS